MNNSDGNLLFTFREPPSSAATLQLADRHLNNVSLSSWRLTAKRMTSASAAVIGRQRQSFGITGCRHLRILQPVDCCQNSGGWVVDYRPVYFTLGRFTERKAGLSVTVE